MFAKLVKWLGIAKLIAAVNRRRRGDEPAGRH